MPAPGDEFNAVADERMARQLVEQRKQAEKDAAAKQASKVTLDNLFDQMQQGEMKELNLIVKADVQGVCRGGRPRRRDQRVRYPAGLKIVVGVSNERGPRARDPRGRRRDQRVRYSAGSRATTATNAIVVGFNVRPDAAACPGLGSVRANVDIRMYRVIYDAIDAGSTAAAFQKKCSRG